MNYARPAPSPSELIAFAQQTISSTRTPSANDPPPYTSLPPAANTVRELWTQWTTCQDGRPSVLEMNRVFGNKNRRPGWLANEAAKKFYYRRAAIIQRITDSQSYDEHDPEPAVLETKGLRVRQSKSLHQFGNECCWWRGRTVRS